jgi:predicted DNA-binding antitoxin AbrB/MazE fold protein
MSQIIEAIFENGVFRPLAPPAGVSEHEKVKLSIEHEATLHPLIDFCGTVPDADTREIEQIISDEFEKVNPDEWR